MESISKKYYYLFILFIGILVSLVACKKTTHEEVISDYSTVVNLGGSSSIDDQTSYAFSYKIKGLSSEQGLQFFVGNSFFNQNWVVAPSATTARDGLGPLFNAKDCSACHFRDGRGKPTAGNGILFRLGDVNGNTDLNFLGQLQDNGILTVDKEGEMEISYQEIDGTYPDGTHYSLRKPIYSISNQHYGGVAASIAISPRVGQQMIGLGLLEIIPESTILQYVDEFDSNQDGISGKANYMSDPVSGSLMIGRFGWKANQPTLLAQVAGAFNGDLGITSSVFPNHGHSTAQNSLNSIQNGGEPEIDDSDLEAVLLYSRTLSVPKRRNATNEDVKKGAKLFNEMKCVSCHRFAFKTGNTGNISPLKNQYIFPFSDLLLHDMGEDLADNVPNHLATGKEWRTQPLWGLGLISIVNGHTFLLHDGRARSIEEAILWHGGEAEKSKQAFKNLSSQARNQVIKFLESL